MKMKKFSQLLSSLSNYLASRKGLLLFIAVGLVGLNFIFSLFMNNWMVETNLLLHLGIIIGFFGVMIAWAL